MEAMRNIMEVNYRVFFTNKEEMSEWLSARRFIDDDPLDIIGDPVFADYSSKETKNNKKYTLRIKKEIFFEDGRLKPMTKSEWKDDYITLIEQPVEDIASDLPF